MTFLFMIAAVLAALWLVGTSRATTETPEYEVVRSDGKFEIRDYPELTVATTPMSEGGMNQGFGQLFRFITGNNKSKEKIAMTAPVLIDTANAGRTMSFIMPKKNVEKGLPQPIGENVRLGKVGAARYAVLRFGGGRTAQNEREAIAKLRALLDARSIAAKGDPIFAYYDPPWTPTFLRRNEVLIRIVDAPE